MSQKSRITGKTVCIGDTVYREYVKPNGEKYLIPTNDSPELPEGFKMFYVPLRLVW